MRIVIFGASGFVGSEIIPLLLESGHELVLVSRNRSDTERRFPLAEVSSLQNWCDNADRFDLVLNLVGPDQKGKPSMKGQFQSHLIAIRTIASQAAKMGKVRFMHLSSVRCVDPLDLSPYTTAKRQAEEIVLETFGGGCEILRVGAVLGTKCSGRRRFLNYFYGSVGRSIRDFSSAVSPVTNVEAIVAAIEAGPKAGLVSTLLVSDREALLPYRLWRSSLNGAFLLGIFAFLPLWLLIWLIIVVFDGFPGLFLQERVGRSGQIFRCVKFRTLAKGTPQVGTHLLEKGSFTSTGFLLRATKIDEIPQVINVLTGAMHLIGPRPALPSQKKVHEAREFFGATHATPGLTGWAQVNGVDMSEPNRLAQLDYEYLQIRSILWDVKILWRTFRKRSR